MDGGRGRISNHEYFTQAVKIIYGLIGDHRPSTASCSGSTWRCARTATPGPPAVSLGALEDYFQVQGREWERFAWLKSRVVAPARLRRKRLGAGAARRVLPFVFRRYLDYNVFDSLRVLHQQIREHAAKRSAGRPERANDVKLSRGGIREIEFTVQLLQVVRGGQFPELRTRPTLQALQRVAAAGLMPQATADALARAYEFLRRVEHRIQYLDDQQTHVLPMCCSPEDDGDLNWIARTMGYADCCPFLHELDAHRELVAQEFDRLLGGARARMQGLRRAPGRARRRRPTWTNCWSSCRRKLRERVALWQRHPRVHGAARRRPRPAARGWSRAPAQWLDEGRVSEEAALRMADWIEPLLRRESYLALLLERPGVHERLLRLLGAARWPARYLLQHPGVIDELASDQLVSERFSGRRFRERTRAAAALAADHRRRRRRGPAEPAAPRAPRRGVPHAGARRGRAAHGGAGGRRPERAGRRRAARDRPLVLAAPEERGIARRRGSRSSATASSAARNWATAATWTSCSSTRTRTSARPKPMPPSCAS